MKKYIYMSKHDYPSNERINKNTYSWHSVSATLIRNKPVVFDGNFVISLTFRRRIKSRLPFAGIIGRLPYYTRFQDKG